MGYRPRMGLRAGSSWGSLCFASLVACGGGDPVEAGSTSSESGSESGGATAATTQPSTSAPTSTSASSTDATTTSADETSSSTSETGNETGVVVDCNDLEGAITSQGLHAHLEAFAQIATDNGGNRAVGSPGYAASIDYVRAQLEEVGYTVLAQDFSVNVFTVLGPSNLAWAGVENYDEFSDYQVAVYSAPGNESATARAVDVQLGAGNNSTSGCEAGDFAGFPAGNIAVIQRGTCFTYQKVLNAQAAGAVGAVIFNQGNDDSRMGVWLSGLGAQTPITIPVLLTTYAIGRDIANAAPGSVSLAMSVDVSIDSAPTTSLVVETGTGDEEDVLMFGAHLDSVPAGPGINDNGSGSASLLELARAVSGCATSRRVRFGWWAAEEVGLVGSQHYVDSLDQAQRNAISLYVNFDMLASPNYVPFIYDGDGSAYGTSGPTGSAELEQLFTDWFDAQGIATEEAPFDGRSDYGPFIGVGVGAGGLATGAEGIKSQEQADMHGGQAGQPYDACYHGECDDLDNVDMDILTTMSRAGAHVIQQYAIE